MAYPDDGISMRVQSTVPCAIRESSIRLSDDSSPVSLEIARCRLVLSAVALGMLLAGAGARGDAPVTAALAIIATHFALASAIVLMADGGLPAWGARIGPWLDAAGAVALPL